MRAFRAVIPLIITFVVVFLLNRPLGSLPALGSLLDPMHGAWANAEATDADFTNELSLPGLRGPAKVWFDEYLKPHVRASNDHDVYYIQGYIHAYFRLWQMDLQVRAAGGRVSEILGAKALEFDRMQRRKGMVYGAEQSLSAIEAEPHTKMMLDAYRDGVNAYIAQLDYEHYPLEYKLIGFKPERWDNIKTALLLKYMADDLTGYTEDIQLTLLRDALPADVFAQLYPERNYQSTPVIPSGTAHHPPLFSKPSVPEGPIWGHLDSADFDNRVENEGKGSNNWAVGPSRTRSGAAILCNDPHLGLNLPALWFEIQMQAPGLNVYGVSLPGAPGVIIGFTDSVSWGFTNNYRDVKDFYTIELIPGNNEKYLFGGRKATFNKRIEHIDIKGGTSYDDTVLYTVHGPVVYDRNFAGKEKIKRPLAMTWMAHRPSNELYAIYMMNRAANYDQFAEAIMSFHCPAQNIVYADKTGNIALWGQGQFINKWKDQGRYVMNGTENSTRWGAEIPTAQNPHVLNPAQGFVSSANQTVTDTTYPYWYNGYFYDFRAWRINEQLAAMNGAGVQDMFRLQQDTYSILAAKTLPILLQYLSANNDKYIAGLRNWDYNLAAGSVPASVFQVWWSQLYKELWKDVAGKVALPLYPSHERTMELILQRSPLLGDLQERATTSYRLALDSLAKLEKDKGDKWYQVKNTGIRHLAKLNGFSYEGLEVGGWGNTVNAVKGDHGPSWRMVVQMSANTEAYGIYPGGQSGNPGSKYYSSFIDKWAKGAYQKLLFLPGQGEPGAEELKYTWTLKHKQP